jgi:hypothetical protein
LGCDERHGIDCSPQEHTNENALAPSGRQGVWVYDFWATYRLPVEVQVPLSTATRGAVFPAALTLVDAAGRRYTAVCTSTVGARAVRSFAGGINGGASKEVPVASTPSASGIGSSG